METMTFSGFMSKKQELTYDKFIVKALEMITFEILNYVKGETVFTQFDKKMIKLYKALTIMEHSKQDGINFSSGMKELVTYF